MVFWNLEKAWRLSVITSGNLRKFKLVVKKAKKEPDLNPAPLEGAGIDEVGVKVWL